MVSFLLILLVPSINAYDLDCGPSAACTAGNPGNCVPNDACKVWCDGSGEGDVCRDNVINANNASNVTVYCINDNDNKACQGSKINCQTATGKCRVECNETSGSDDTCTDAIVNCDDGFCEVICHTESGTTCKNMKVNCGNSVDCNLDCTENDGGNLCSQSTLNCGQFPCHQTCDSSLGNVCYQSSLNCNTSSCSLNCNGSSFSCTQMDVVTTLATEWMCQGNGCDNNMAPPFTANPTPQPTPIPSLQPTPIPSSQPTIIPTQISTEIPSSETDTPTLHPTPIPTALTTLIPDTSTNVPTELSSSLSVITTTIQSTVLDEGIVETTADSVKNGGDNLEENDNGISNVWIYGIVVGIIICLLICIFCFNYLKLRKKKRIESEHNQIQSSVMISDNNKIKRSQKGNDTFNDLHVDSSDNDEDDNAYIEMNQLQEGNIDSVNDFDGNIVDDVSNVVVTTAGGENDNNQQLNDNDNMITDNGANENIRNDEFIITSIVTPKGDD